MSEPELEFAEEDDAELVSSETQDFSQAVLYSSDWTVETVVSQLVRKNIDLNPRFQRRDAWNAKAKSRFIESIILGLPIPQIVLAEKENQRGQFIVLDGKQRLLSLLQFTGSAEGPKNAFRLSGMEARPDLDRTRYSDLVNRADSDLNAFLNHTIRTVVIRNWPSMQFLHLVFLRLNTGSVKLSPQELRQAVVPGPFSDYVDDAALASSEAQALLSRTTPDPRMRDVELIVRYLAFANLVTSYTGRMKLFLDNACTTFNREWEARCEILVEQVQEFAAGVDALTQIFGVDGIARKKGSRSFNRAIFDALIFYVAKPSIRSAMLDKSAEVLAAYNKVLENEAFADAVESDTAGTPHTVDRLRIWGEALRGVTNLDFALPALSEENGAARISYAG